MSRLLAQAGHNLVVLVGAPKIDPEPWMLAMWAQYRSRFGWPTFRTTLTARRKR